VVRPILGVHNFLGMSRVWQDHDTGAGDANAVSYLVRLLFLGMTSLFGDLPNFGHVEDHLRISAL
jgi:hypothetical protein